MKKSELNVLKGLSVKELFARVKALKQEIAADTFDLNMKKLKDIKSVFKKRKDLARLLTIVKQKQLLKELELKK